MQTPALSVCFVCAGNICRSPTAEAVFEALVEEAGLSGVVDVDSAGTGGWHAGEEADPRARAAARLHGIEIEGVARRFTAEDFERFDIVVAMDLENVLDLNALTDHEGQRAKVRLLREFDPGAGDELEVPDPYYTYEGEDGFNVVFDMCRVACAGLLDEVVAMIGTTPDT
ncbi:MAG: low molecular weight phosphotyrosine protein phosphatase [Acidimicrobiia bacterium]|nr:low molecular weight phosphotyrosine protein phosphatase [Acidimicrobiia bacterium]